MFAASLKRAALLEEFLQAHRFHSGPSGGCAIEFNMDDSCATRATCPCGTSFIASVIINVQGEIAK